MTLEENKKMALALIEEYSPTSSYLTDDPDIQTNINVLYNLVYFRLSELYGIVESVELNVPQGQSYVEMSLPSNMSKMKELYAVDINNVPQDDKEFYRLGKDKIFIRNPKGYKYQLEYYKYPSQITEDTADDFELEIELKAQMILPYGVASSILINDPSANYSAFEAKYQNELVNLDTDKSEPQVSIK